MIVLRRENEADTVHDCKPIEPLEAAELIGAMSGAIPSGVILEGGSLAVADSDVVLEEEAPLQNAVEKRRREFRAGRIYARRAMSRLGMSPQAIPVGRSRAPVWPPGVVGSISHTADSCAVALCQASLFSALGLDIEGAEPLSEGLTRRVTHASELQQRNIVNRHLGIDLPKLIFVVKEAFYKMYFPLAQRVLSFHDVAVDIDAQACLAQAKLIASNVPRIDGKEIFHGRFGTSGRTLYSFFAYPGPDAPPSA